MRTMTVNEAITKGYKLYETWCSDDKKVNLVRAQSSIRQEIAFTKILPARMSAGCLRECRNDLKAVGSILKRHPDLFQK